MPSLDQMPLSVLLRVSFLSWCAQHRFIPKQPLDGTCHASNLKISSEDDLLQKHTRLNLPKDEKKVSKATLVSSDRYTRPEPCGCHLKVPLSKYAAIEKIPSTLLTRSLGNCSIALATVMSIDLKLKGF
jgi:hypothetical protein